MSLAQKNKPTDQIDFNAGPQGSDANGNSYQTPVSTNDNDTQSPRDTGTLVVNDEGTRYLESANWRAILKEVSRGPPALSS